MSHLIDYNYNPPSDRKQQREKWIQLINQAEQQKSIERQAKMLLQLEQTKHVQDLMNAEKYFTALKYIKQEFPEFKKLHSKTYKWLKKAEKENLNNNNIENLAVVNISNFTAPTGNKLENVNVYTTFSSKRGGLKKTYRKSHYKRKTHKKH
jgi:RecJ-like exonuclease